MANTIITLVIDTQDPDLDAILAAAINEVSAAGHTLKEVRVADDSGEVLVAPNTVAGVVPPPEPEVTAPATDVPEDTPDASGGTPVATFPSS